MIVEWLRIRVAPADREKFVQQDYEIWTAFLQQVPGFLRKEVWISPDDPSEVMLAIRWRTLEEQQAIPAMELLRVKAQFQRALGVPFQFLEIKLL